MTVTRGIPTQAVSGGTLTAVPIFHARRIPARSALLTALALLTLAAASLVHAQTPDQSAQSTPSAAPSRSVTVDFTAVKGPTSQVFKQCVGAGRANEGLRADWQRQLSDAKRRCDFRYIRMHGLLDDDMGVYFEDKNGRPEYNWQYIDELYDFLLRIHVRPFVELGFMPGALASGPQTIFWYRANVTPPRDYGKWHDLVLRLVQHWTERYGAAEVRNWYFEVWNEPNLSGFWSGTQQDYFKLYASTASAIKAVSPAYRVGGPATAGAAWIPEFIRFCARNAVPVDFISGHNYGVDQGFLDASGDRGTVLSHAPDSVFGNMIASRAAIKASALPGLPLHYTEWSASYTPSDPIHDSYYEAPFILDKVKNASPYVDSMSYWTFTDIFEEAGPRRTPFHGGFGLMNYQDIKKPAFYAYEYLNKLGPTELVNRDTRSTVTKDRSGGIQALFWDYTITQPTTVNDQAYYVRDLPARPHGALTLTIRDVPAGRYVVTVYRIGYRVNDAFETYHDLGSPSQLTRAQVAEIKSRNDGAPVSRSTVTLPAKATFSRRFPLRDNDVYLVTLSRMGTPARHAAPSASML